MLQGGVDMSHVNWRDFDGIGRKTRVGLNFTENAVSASARRSVARTVGTPPHRK